MKFLIKKERILNIFILISLVGFLVLPQFSLGDFFEELTKKEIEEYLSLQENIARSLLGDLNQVFTTEKINLETSAYSTDQERAIPTILRSATRIHVLNHLLIDAPLDVLGKVIKHSVELARLILAKDISVVIKKFEEESVKKAVTYGMNFLLQNEIRISPGAIRSEYISYKGTKTEAVFQHIVVFHPLDSKRAKVEVRFYSPDPIEPPKSTGSIMFGTYHNLQDDLPPFTVNIDGSADKRLWGNYGWTNHPFVKIDFPETVQDLGIIPPNFLERNLLNPIKSTFSDLKVILAKITGGSSKIVEDIFNTFDMIIEFWDGIKRAVAEFAPFAPASLVQGPGSEEIEKIEEVFQTKEGLEEEISEIETLIETREELEDKPETLLSEIQEILDDLLERVDVFSEEVKALIKEKESERVELEESEEIIEESEEVVELEEAVPGVVEVSGINKEEADVILCKKNSQPARNIIINEIAWMGTHDSANDEWLELKNISTNPIELNGWQLLDKENQIAIIFDKEIVSANGFLLLERTDDESAPGTIADLIYTGALGNTEEVLYLFNKDCQLEDEALALPAWPAGDNYFKRTLERKLDLNWQTSANSGGTPKRKNSGGFAGAIGGGTAPPSPAEPQEEKSIPEILITEVQIKTASSSDHDFIELYNLATTSFDISGFQLKKKNSNRNEFSVRVFPENSIIPAKAYFIWLNSGYASSSQIIADAISSQTLAKNNSVALLDGNNNIIDALGWGSSTDSFSESLPFPDNPEEDQSLARKWSTSTESYIDTNNNQEDFEIQIPTPKEKNASFDLAVNQLPTAQFVFVPENPIINQEILFDASSSTDPDGQIVSFIWDFGEGTLASTSQATTSYFYATSSDFIISLQVIDDKGATSSLATSSISVTEIEDLSLDVVINEIAWMGTNATNSADEWIELKNNTDEAINLTDWTLSAFSGSPVIVFSTSSGSVTIPAYGFYLLERTDDQTVSNISADRIYVGGLENSGERLELRDTNGNLVDLIDCSTGWFGGEANPNYTSMERIDSRESGATSTNWASNNLITKNGLDTERNSILGTPKVKNSVSETDTEIGGIVDYPVLTYLGSPYIVIKHLVVPSGKTLTIEPGVVLRFKPGAGLETRGTLKAIGEEGRSIVFTSFSPPSYWPGLLFTIPSTDSELDFTEIRYAKWGLGEAPSVLVDNTSITLRNSIIEKYDNRGLKLINSSSTVENVNFLGQGINTSIVGIEIKGGSPVIKNCDLIKDNKHGILVNTLTSGGLPQIEGNNFEYNKYPIYIRNPDVITKDNRGENNTINGIIIYGTISQDITWFKNDFPYVIYTNYFLIVDPGVTLTINPGVVFKGYSRANITISGRLLAVGSLAEPIIFTSIYDNNSTSSLPSAGDWGGIRFLLDSYGSVLENIRFSYGGEWYENGLVSVLETKVYFNEVIISNSSEKGLYLVNSSSTISNSYFKNNTVGIGIYGLDNCPQLDNVSFGTGSEANDLNFFSQRCDCIPEDYIGNPNVDCQM